MTSGGETTCDDQLNALPTASSLALSFGSLAYWCFVPAPQENSTCGSTSLNAAAGSVQVGATPVPVQTPASHVMNAGQSQSSSHVQAPAPAASALQVLAK